MVDIEQIEAEVVKTLQLIPDLKKVYDHEPKNLGMLPAATLYFDGFGQGDATSRRKEITWRWMVRIYIPLQDEVKAQRMIKSLVQKSIQQLAENPELGGTVIDNNLTNGEIYVAMDQSNPHMIAEMTLEAKVQLTY